MENNELEKLKGKNWMAAMSLCWLLGAFGAHRFYTGKTKSAWAMLALTILGFTAPISSIWMLIDGIVLAIGDFTHADGSYLYERKPWFGYLYTAYVVIIVLGSILLSILFLTLGAAILQAPEIQAALK